MGETPTSQDRAAVRAAAGQLAGERGGLGDQARGTLAALDWIEGRRDLTPSSRESRRPDDVVERGHSRMTALSHEEVRAEDWGQGLGREPIGASFQFHGAVWALLRWTRNRDHSLAIDVPGLDRARSSAP